MTEKRKPSYWELLKDPRWQRMRLEVLQRENFKCQVCGSGDKCLNVHHTSYRKGAAPWECDDAELLVLCEDCHGAHHEMRARIDRVVETIGAIPVLMRMLVGYAEELAESTPTHAMFARIRGVSPDYPEAEDDGRRDYLHGEEGRRLEVEAFAARVAQRDGK